MDKLSSSTQDLIMILIFLNYSTYCWLDLGLSLRHACCKQALNSLCTYHACFSLGKRRVVFWSNSCSRWQHVNMGLFLFWTAISIVHKKWKHEKIPPGFLIPTLPTEENIDRCIMCRTWTKCYQRLNIF